MQRRTFIALAPALLAAPSLSLAAGKVGSLDDALRWLDTLEKTAAARTTAGWPLPAVLQHLAQSIEMSVQGFPAPKSALFQNTLGAAAFTVFKWRGKMSHGLAEPIPGAPALNMQQAMPESITRLRKAIASFNTHSGALKPHFAYGNLSRTDYALAHSFHIANHQDEITLGA